MTRKAIFLGGGVGGRGGVLGWGLLPCLHSPTVTRAHDEEDGEQNEDESQVSGLVPA